MRDTVNCRPKMCIRDRAIVLVATSGDTGKAALEGFRDVDGTGIAVFYPVDGVSQIQRLQMATQQGSNVAVQAVEGNFDAVSYTHLDVYKRQPQRRQQPVSQRKPVQSCLFFLSQVCTSYIVFWLARTDKIVSGALNPSDIICLLYTSMSPSWVNSRSSSSKL